MQPLLNFVPCTFFSNDIVAHRPGPIFYSRGQIYVAEAAEKAVYTYTTFFVKRSEKQGKYKRNRSAALQTLRHIYRLSFIGYTYISI